MRIMRERVLVGKLPPMGTDRGGVGLDPQTSERYLYLIRGALVLMIASGLNVAWSLSGEVGYAQPSSEPLAVEPLDAEPEPLDEEPEPPKSEPQEAQVKVSEDSSAPTQSKATQADDQPTEPPTDQPADQPADQTPDQTPDQPADQPAMNSLSKEPPKVSPKLSPKGSVQAPNKTKGASETLAPPTIVEGELVNVGQVGLLPWENRFGLQIGLERLGEIYYGAVNVGINHNFEVDGRPLHLTLGVPLRFELLDARPNQRFDNIGRFRSQDWDEASDFAKVIQRFQFGSKEQRFYLDINRYSAHTLGHGLIMKRYDANLNFNTSRVGVQLDAFSDYIGFESTLNDITRPNLIGALVFIKPLSLINREHYMTRSFSIGVTGVTDLASPVRNALDEQDIDNDGRRSSELRLNQQTFRPDSLTTPVRAYGLDAEIKLVDKREFDLKTYLDYSFLDTGLPVGDPNSIDPEVVGSTRVRSSGFAWGHLIRSNLGLDPIHALRVRLEYRNYDPNYLPSYFDSLYEIQSIQYLPGGVVQDLANATKLQRVFSRNAEGARVHGGYFEASWRIGNVFAIAMGLEVNNQTPDNHAFIHFELPRAGKWQLSSTYHRRNAANRAELFETRFAENDIWMFQTRHRTLSWLNTNLSVMTPFGFGPESVLRNAIQVNLSLEMGFAYKDDKKPKRLSGAIKKQSHPLRPPAAPSSQDAKGSTGSQRATPQSGVGSSPSPGANGAPQPSPPVQPSPSPTSTQEEREDQETDQVREEVKAEQDQPAKEPSKAEEQQSDAPSPNEESPQGETADDDLPQVEITPLEEASPPSSPSTPPKTSPTADAREERE